MYNHSIPQETSPLNEWLDYLKHVHNRVIDLGLERVQHVAARLELLSPAATVFTVAGTNGKGTTCCALEAMLLASGLRVGVYSSPHLISYTERVRIQGTALNQLAISHSFSVIEQGRAETSLTYFEFGTLSALYLFKQAQLDVVILEVGLGGRLDATNIIDPSVAIITTIALDHTNLLGNDRAVIGTEKAGIFRSGVPAIVGEPDMPATIREAAEALGASLYHNGIAWSYTEQGHYWQWKASKTLIVGLPMPNVPLVNAATALAAVHYSSLHIGYQAIYSGLQKAMLPGRFQVVHEEPRLILDVAHNPHAASYLALCLAKLPRNGGKVRAVVAMLSDKDIPGTLAAMSDQVDEWYCAPLGNHRGAHAELLTRHLSQKYRNFSNVQSAWLQAMQDAKKYDIVIVFGSFYVVAQVMKMLDKR